MEQAEITDKWGVNNKGRDTTQSYQAKGKETMAVEMSEEAPLKQKKGSSNNNPEFKFSLK